LIKVPSSENKERKISLLCPPKTTIFPLLSLIALLTTCELLSPAVKAKVSEKTSLAFVKKINIKRAKIKKFLKKNPHFHTSFPSSQNFLLNYKKSTYICKDGEAT